MSYGKPCTLMYDADKPMPPGQELALYVAMLGPPSQAGAILEPMCGSGRFLVPLLWQGYDVYGFDRSPHMLAACLRRLRQAGLDESRVQCCGFADYGVPARFAHCIIPAGSFSLITPMPAVRAALLWMSGLVIAAGRLLVEVCTRGADMAVASTSAKEIPLPDGTVIQLRCNNRWDAADGVETIYCAYEQVRNGMVECRETEVLGIRRWRAQEFAREARDAGLSVLDCREGVFGDSRALFVLVPSPRQ